MKNVVASIVGDPSRRAAAQAIQTFEDWFIGSASTHLGFSSTPVTSLDKLVLQSCGVDDLNGNYPTLKNWVTAARTAVVSGVSNRYPLRPALLTAPWMQRHTAFLRLGQTLEALLMQPDDQWAGLEAKSALAPRFVRCLLELSIADLVLNAQDSDNPRDRRASVAAVSSAIRIIAKHTDTGIPLDVLTGTAGLVSLLERLRAITNGVDVLAFIDPAHDAVEWGDVSETVDWALDQTSYEGLVSIAMILDQYAICVMAHQVVPLDSEKPSAWRGSATPVALADTPVRTPTSAAPQG